MVRLWFAREHGTATHQLVGAQEQLVGVARQAQRRQVHRHHARVVGRRLADSRRRRCGRQRLVLRVQQLRLGRQHVRVVAQPARLQTRDTRRGVAVGRGVVPAQPRCVVVRKPPAAAAVTAVTTTAAGLPVEGDKQRHLLSLGEQHAVRDLIQRGHAGWVGLQRPHQPRRATLPRPQRQVRPPQHQTRLRHQVHATSTNNSASTSASTSASALACGACRVVQRRLLEHATARRERRRAALAALGRALVGAVACIAGGCLFIFRHAFQQRHDVFPRVQRRHGVRGEAHEPQVRHHAPPVVERAGGGAGGAALVALRGAAALFQGGGQQVGVLLLQQPQRVRVTAVQVKRRRQQVHVVVERAVASGGCASGGASISVTSHAQ